MDPIAPTTRVPETRPDPRDTSFSVGEVLARSFRVFARWCWVLIPLACLFRAPPALMELYRVHRMYAAWDDRHITTSVFELFGGWWRVATLLAEWVLPLAFQAIVTFAVFQSLRGTPARWGASIGHGLRRLPHALGASLLLVLAVAVPAIGATYAFLHFFFTGTGEREWAVLLLFQGLFVGYVVFLACRFLVGMQVAVVEGTGPLRALIRSARLTRRVRWRVLAIVLVVYAVPYTLEHAVGKALAAAAAEDRAETWRVDARAYESAHRRAHLVETGMDLVFASLQAVTVAVAYHALRRAKEGTQLDELLAVFD